MSSEVRELTEKLHHMIQAGFQIHAKADQHMSYEVNFERGTIKLRVTSTKPKPEKKSKPKKQSVQVDKPDDGYDQPNLFEGARG